MTRLYFNHALLASGWAANVTLEINPSGTIVAIETDSDGENCDDRAEVALPGLPNVHSHAFQRALAGRAEVQGDGTDSFWTWRQVMYKFLERVTPTDLYAIACMAYCEMLEAGMTSVCEFHYLHHGPDGHPYGDIGEMAQAIGEAAKTTGIGLTFLPVFYAQSQFGGADPGPQQRRFINDPERFGKLLERIDAIAGSLADARVGIAPHSLRAVTPDSLNQILAFKPDGPLHIHIAEQTKEVDDCLAWSGQRPVEWLIDHVNVDRRWCLVHATHMSGPERRRLAASGAVAGLCPITEANLGDGTFDGVHFLAEGGRIAIGSDSNVLIDAAEELRTLEYSQRLRDQGRNLLSNPQKSTGRHLYDQVLAGGAQASGRHIGRLSVGNRGDILSLDTSHPALIGSNLDGWLDSWIFAANSSAVSDLWVGGRRLVSAGQHRDRQTLRAQYSQTIKRLSA